MHSSDVVPFFSLMVKVCVVGQGEEVGKRAASYTQTFKSKRFGLCNVGRKCVPSDVTRERWNEAGRSECSRTGWCFVRVVLERNTARRMDMP